MTIVPILKHFDFIKFVVLKTNSSNYINGNILSQPDNDGLLHFVAFYSKNFDPAKCNYDIYNKEFLTVIRAFEKWQPKLKNTEIPIQIFTDHKNLKYFQSNKKLFCRQSRWMEILFYYNFIIIYYSGKQNTKTNALTHCNNKQPAYTSNKHKLFRHQTLFFFECFNEINTIIIISNSTGLFFFDEIKQTNHNNKKCKSYYTAIKHKQTENISINLQYAISKNKVLYWYYCFWIFTSYVITIIKKVYN